jgi:predicted alpha/beta-hydrolase family hydrolase
MAMAEKIQHGTRDADHTVSALCLAPRGVIAAYVFAHGAGAGMAHPFMEAVAKGLAARRIATMRYQFPSMESGSRRPDRPALAEATVAAAVRKAAPLAPRLPLIAGGKSFGGRMTSQAQAREPLPKVRGLAFLGFPLHLAKKPSTERAAHLAEVHVPMLFVQGDRDTLADMKLLRSVPSISARAQRCTPSPARTMASTCWCARGAPTQKQWTRRSTLWRAGRPS